ncbi:MAG: hypothetical protein H6693_07895 [Candidatus Latescibacteria bacterium]|nr:hypothetical protein [Candidatus Latescibacterota bacterium]MCB9516101.1 hypothetical protein [Candidatus Latescibacterota bacterium]
MASIKLSPFSMWLLALVFTAMGLVVQRRTGERMPLELDTPWQGRNVSTVLARNHVGPGGQRLVVEGVDPDWTGTVIWRRYGGGGEYRRESLRNLGSMLSGELSPQPRGSALEYRVEVEAQGGKLLRLPERGTVITRYKGAIPLWVSLPHLLLLYLGLFLGVRAGLEALALGSGSHTLAGVALICFLFGGLLFGPLMKVNAYGILWKGPPLGLDSTDTKTLVLVLAWLAPVILRARGRRARRWIVLAAVLSVIAFLIPHSVFGVS